MTKPAPPVCKETFDSIQNYSSWFLQILTTTYNLRSIVAEESRDAAVAIAVGLLRETIWTLQFVLRLWWNVKEGKWGNIVVNEFEFVHNWSRWRWRLPSCRVTHSHCWWTGYWRKDHCELVCWCRSVVNARKRSVKVQGQDAAISRSIHLQLLELYWSC